MEEEWRGHKKKKRVLAESGKKRERRGIEGLERYRKEGRQQSRGSERRGHDGTQVPSGRLSALRSPNRALL